MIELKHELVSHDGSGAVFEVKIGGASFIDGHISPFDHKLKVGAWSRSKLTLAEVAECAEAWKLAAETVRLHEQCFLWKLEFSAVPLDKLEEREFCWYIWAPTAEVAHERFLNSVADDPFVSEIQRVVCDAVMKGTWVRA